MRQFRGVFAVLLVALGWQSAGLGTALGCSCMPPPSGVQTPAQLKAWKFENAKEIVRGRILNVRADRDLELRGNAVAEATMKIGSTIKGAVPVGNVKLMTLIGCGIVQVFLAGVALDGDVTLEIHAVPEQPGRYMVDMCGYQEMNLKSRDH